MVKKNKCGRKPKELSKELMQKYADFLFFLKLGDMGKKALSLMGYSEFTKKEFCQKYSVSIDTPADWEKNSEFKDIFFEKSMTEAFYDLPYMLKVAIKKGNIKEFVQFIHPKKAKELFSEKQEITGLNNNPIIVKIIETKK